MDYSTPGEVNSSTDNDNVTQRQKEDFYVVRRNRSLSYYSQLRSVVDIDNEMDKSDDEASQSSDEE